MTFHLPTAQVSAPIVQAPAENDLPSFARALTPDQALKRIARLEADLLECREYIEDHVDVDDGDYGEPSPNRAMSLVNMIDETLNGVG